MKNFPFNASSRENRRGRLSCHLFEFAGQVGDLQRIRNEKEHLRRSKYARVLKEALDKNGGKGLEAAKQEAEFAIGFERGEEAAAESDFAAARTLAGAGKDVLDTMNQHISTLKEERRLEGLGMGSQ